MARARNLLTDRAIRAAIAKPVEGTRLTDGGGVYLEIRPGGAFWRHKFRVNGRERLLSLGEYPTITLARARALAEANRRAAAEGIDPLEQRRAREAQARQQAVAQRDDAADTFAAWAKRYQEAREPGWSSVHARDVERILAELCNGYVAPDGRRLSRGFGKTPMRALDKAHILEVVDGALERGSRSYADDLVTYAQAVARYFNGRQPRGRKIVIDDLDVAGIREAMGRAPASKPHPRLPLHEMPAFMRRLRTESTATLRVRRATQLLLLTGTRTIELRSMQWDHLDLANATWTVPAERMKHRRKVWAEFHVPLSRQAQMILEKLRADREALEDDDPRKATLLVFFNERDPAQPMSENTVLAHLKRLGYAGRQTGHGFRGLVSTWGNRQGFNRDAIERQLSHVEADKVRGAYNEWEFWPERQRLMQAWADALDAWFLEAMRAGD